MISWYLENGKEADVVSFSSVSLARNLQGVSFASKMTNEDRKELLEKVKYSTPSIGYGLTFLALKDMDDITKMSLVEKHIIPIQMVNNQTEQGAILINEEENICILVGGEEHFVIQVFQAGFALQDTMNLAIELDEKLDGLFHFACHKEYGYLTSCPLQAGTGLTTSILLHLPALKMTGNLSKVLHIMNHFGMSVHGAYGEDAQIKGDLYCITNGQTIGMTEKEIIMNTENMVRKVMEQERTARKILIKNRMELEDRVYRSYGILKNARKLTFEETIELLSDVKLGTDLGMIEELNDAKVKKMLLYAKPANLQKLVGNVLNGYEREIKRAEMIKQIANEQ